jgi:hypothetical protein
MKPDQFIKAMQDAEAADEAQERVNAIAGNVLYVSQAEYDFAVQQGFVVDERAKVFGYWLVVQDRLPDRPTVH